MATRKPTVRPKVGVGSMIMKDGKVLLGKRKGAHGEGVYGWVGGHLEFGETLEECAKREVWEETGLIVTSLELICMSNVIAYNTHYIDFEFKVEVEAGEPKLTEPDRVECWEWHDLNNLPEPLFKAVELGIQSYKNGNFYNP